MGTRSKGSWWGRSKGEKYKFPYPSKLLILLYKFAHNRKFKNDYKRISKTGRQSRKNQKGISKSDWYEGRIINNP